MAHLVLNQTGFSAGWVAQDSVWFVPKMVADAVRAYLEKHESNQSIPSDNNRLFDTWQEYGALVPNPQTDQALWNIFVKTKDGEKALNALRFPLDKLFSKVEDYPVPFTGEIRILSNDSKTSIEGEVEVNSPAVTLADKTPATTALEISNPTLLDSPSLKALKPTIEPPVPKMKNNLGGIKQLLTQKESAKALVDDLLPENPLDQNQREETEAILIGSSS